MSAGLKIAHSITQKVPAAAYGTLRALFGVMLNDINASSCH